jgi:hypothetical protein
VERAYYSAQVSAFAQASRSEIEGTASVASISGGFLPLETQLEAWRSEISLLNSAD